MINFRAATVKDSAFLLEAIIASEKSGSEVLSYSRIFAITEEEVKELIRQIFEEEIENQEWYIPGFHIATENNTPVACLSSWIEAKDGIGSGILKAQAMSYFLGNKWAAAMEKLQVVSSVQIPRIQGALQLENIYTAPDHRGKGIAGKLILFAIETMKKLEPETDLAEIQLMANNSAGIASYTKCGFLQRAVSVASDPAVLTLLPGDSKVSLTKNI